MIVDLKKMSKLQDPSWQVGFVDAPHSLVLMHTISNVTDNLEDVLFRVASQTHERQHRRQAIDQLKDVIEQMVDDDGNIDNDAEYEALLAAVDNHHQNLQKTHFEQVYQSTDNVINYHLTPGRPVQCGDMLLVWILDEVDDIDDRKESESQITTTETKISTDVTELDSDWRSAKWFIFLSRFLPNRSLNSSTVGASKNT
jgi:hypothetical protein